MQPNEQAEFFRAVGAFVFEQVRLATAPLLTKIDALENQLRALEMRPLVDEDDAQIMIEGAISAAAAQPSEPVKITWRDIEDFGDGVTFYGYGGDQVRAIIDGKMVELKGKDGADGKDGRDGADGEDGKDVDMDHVYNTIERLVEPFQPPSVDDVVKALDEHGIVAKVVSMIPAPKDGRDGENGRDVDYDKLKEILTIATTEYLRMNPAPAGKDGRDGVDGENGRDGRDGATPTKEELETLARGAVLAYFERFPVLNGADGRDGADGKDGVVDMEKVTEQILYAVESYVTAEALGLRKYVDELPKPKDGKDGEPGKDGQNGRDGTDGAPGESVSLDQVRSIVDAAVRDVVSELPPTPHVVSFSIDRDGVLNCIFNDGRISKAGVVVGRDGLDKDAIKALVAAAIAEIPIPKDGKDGRDGLDGVGFDDLEVVTVEGSRDLILRFFRGENKKEFTISYPVMLYQGVWKSGQTYKNGDCVTRDGNVWHAFRDTDAQPGTADSGWQLATKRGRDGRDKG